MQIRPKIQLTFGRQQQPIMVPIADLLIGATQTYLIQNSAAAATTLTVQNITGLAVNQYLLIGEPGNENSEIILTDNVTAPTGQTVTLDAGLVFAHNSNTPVYVLKFNQIEISHAATEAGIKSVLSTVDIVADNPTTNYNDTTQTTGYYFARFKNVIAGNTFSPYSDPAPAGGYTIYSARSIIDKALNAINKQQSSVLTDSYAFSEIDNCQMECLREYQRWSFMQEFNYILGPSYEDQLRVALPASVDDQQTTKSIYNFRMGKHPGLQWVDKEEWDALMWGIAYTTLADDIDLGDTSIVLTNSSDFQDSGTVRINGTDYSYSANNTTTNTLTISASATEATAGMDVTQFGNPGLPSYYTVWQGYAYFYPMVANNYAGLNFYMDFYKVLTQIQHDSDNIVLPDPTVVQYYLEWKFLKKLNNGEDNDASSSAKESYLARRETMKKKEWINRKFIWKPNDYR